MSVRFHLTVTAWSLLGLDDMAYAECFPSFREVKGGLYEASREEALEIADRCDDRANPNDGYEHTPAERRSMASASRKIRLAAAQSTGEGR